MGVLGWVTVLAAQGVLLEVFDQSVFGGVAYLVFFEASANNFSAPSTICNFPFLILCDPV